MALKPKAKGMSRASRRPTSTRASQLIDQGIGNRGDWREETLDRMRALILEADPEMTEERKWRKPQNAMAGVPVWSHHGIVCTGECTTPRRNSAVGVVDVGSVALGVDERVHWALGRVACDELPVPAPCSCMVGHPDVGGEAPQHAERALEVGPLFGYRIPPITARSQALTTLSTWSLSRTGNDHEMQPRVWPPVTCAVSAIGPTRIVSPSLNRWSTRAGG